MFQRDEELKLDLVKEEDINRNKILMLEISDQVKLNNKYQKILFIIYSLAIFSCVSCMTSYPTQKVLPEFTCLSIENLEQLFKSQNLDVSITDFDMLSAEDNNKLYGNFARLFTPAIINMKNIKIIEDPQCIVKYCHRNSKEIQGFYDEEKFPKKESSLNTPHSKNKNAYVKIIVNYEKLVNWVTMNDALCDYEEFFANVTIVINSSKILGSFIFSYVCDLYGRSIILKACILQILTMYILIFFSSSRLFFYLYISILIINSNLFSTIVTISSESLNTKLFSILNGINAVIFSLSGFLCLGIMVSLQNYYYIAVTALCFSSLVTYLMKIYIIESFNFSLDKNLFKESLNNIFYINKLFDLNIQQDKKTAKDLEELKVFVEKYTKEYLFCSDNLTIDEKDIKDNSNKNEGIQELISKEKEKIQKETKFQMLQDLKKGKEEDISFSDNLRKHSSHFYRLRKFCSIFDKLLGPYLVIFKEMEYLTTFIKFLPLFVTVHIIYYGQFFYIDKISENIFLGNLVIYSSEITGELLSTFYLHHTKRKQAISIGCLISSVMYFIGFIANIEIIRIIFCFFGCIIFSFLFVTMYVISAETFEVKIKSSMISLLKNVSGVFLIFMPFLVKTFGDIFFLFSCFSFVTFLANRFIKETLREKTNETNIS